MAQADRGAQTARPFNRTQGGASPQRSMLRSSARLLLARLLSLLFLLSTGFCCAAGEALIAHPTVPVDSLTQNEARLYMTMRLIQWPNGQRSHVFVLPDIHPLHERVAKGILGLFPFQLRRAWDRQLFSGTGSTPTTVATEAELIWRVATTPGAIGYADSSAMPSSVRRLEVR